MSSQLKNAANSAAKSAAKSAVKSAARKAVSKGVDTGVAAAASTTPMTKAAHLGLKAAKKVAENAAARNQDGLAAKGLEASNKMTKAAATTAVAAPAIQFASMFAVMSYLKTLFFGAVSAVLNGLSALVGAIAAMLKAGALATVGLVGSALSAVGGAALATFAPVVTVGLSIALVLVGGSAASSISGNTAGERDGALNVCSADTRQLVSDIKGIVTGIGQGDKSAQKKENAKAVYTIMKTDGYSDTWIAAILGNFEAESDIDPTSIESIYSEPYTIGPKKQKAIDADFDPAKASLTVSSITTRAGIGYGQWTNDRNKLLVDYAKKVGKDWYTSETQISFMLGADDPTAVKTLQSFKSRSNASIQEATNAFRVEWERNTVLGHGQSHEAAAFWLAEMADWKISDSERDNAKKLIDESKKHSSANVAESATSSSNQRAITKAANDCQTSGENAGGIWDGDLGGGAWTNPCAVAGGCAASTSVFAYRNFQPIDCQINHCWHWGDDLMTPGDIDVPAIAMADAKVIDFNGPDGMITLEVQDGGLPFKISYSHMRNIKVKVGDEVKKGQILGTASDYSERISSDFPGHIHLEMYEPGAPVENYGWFTNRQYTINPEPIMRAKGAWSSSPLEMSEEEAKNLFQYGAQFKDRKYGGNLEDSSLKKATG